MAALFYNYEKSGTGVSKNAPKKKRPLLFLQIVWRKLGQLLALNFIYTICCIPIFLIGPATAGLVRVLRKYSVERHAFIIHDFFKSYKQNFKASFIVGISNIFLAVCVYAGYRVYPYLAEQYDSMLLYVPLIIMLSIAFTTLIMSFYSYIMIVTTSISLKNIIKNSFFLTLAAFKTNIITLLLAVIIILAVAALVIYNLSFVLLLPFMPISLIWLLICFNCYPVVERFVITPYYEERGEVNPEHITTQDGETLFADKGGHEAPILPKNTKKRGRTIK